MTCIILEKEAKMKRFTTLLLIIFSTVAIISAGGARDKKTGTTDKQKLRIYTSVLPQKYFVDRIGGNTVEVEAMVQKGFSPGTYEPKPEQMTALADSAAFFRIGAPFEQVWLGKIAAVNPSMKIVDTTKGVSRIPSGKGFDPHIWLGPEAVKIQVQNIRDALIELNPADKPLYETNCTAFISEVESLQTELKKRFSTLKVRAFVVYHPAWSYFAQDFGLEQIAVEKNGQEPNAGDLAELVKKVQALNLKLVIVHPEFSTRAAEILAGEIGGKTVVVSPLNPDWFTNMRTVTDAIIASAPQ
jgi:zinc transport system substrate-binding protein